MNKQLCFVFGCVCGVLTGAFATKKFFHDKFERMAQEEIDSVKESFSKLSEKYKQKKKTLNTIYGQGSAPTEKPDLDSYAARIQELESQTIDIGHMDEPEVISPDEFGEDEEYEIISLTYYADGVLSDDDERKMGEADVENSIGLDALNHFGEYEEDMVYVRNGRLKTYYEVCRDERSYEEVLEERPYLKEDE